MSYPTAVVYPTDPYPGFPQTWDSAISRKDDMKVVRSISGKLYRRLFYTAPKYAFTVKHELTLAQMNYLESYYVLFKSTPFTFTLQSDVVDRTCSFAGPPQYNMVQGGLWIASVPLEEE